MFEGSGVNEFVLVRGRRKRPALVPRRFLEAIAGPDQPEIKRGSGRLERVIFARGLPGLGRFFTVGERLPATLRTIAWAVTQLERQIAMVPVARRAVRNLAIDVVHQPISVSPIIPSPLTRLGVPVVMGPLNGGMELPPAFRRRDSLAQALLKAVRPVMAAAMNQVVRGRSDADVVLVANDRTRSLLPRPVRKRAIEMSDIGVVLEAWPVPDQPAPGTAGRAG